MQILAACNRRKTDLSLWYAEVSQFALDDAVARLAGWRLQNADVAETQRCQVRGISSVFCRTMTLLNMAVDTDIDGKSWDDRGWSCNSPSFPVVSFNQLGAALCEEFDEGCVGEMSKKKPHDVLLVTQSRNNQIQIVKWCRTQHICMPLLAYGIRMHRCTWAQKKGLIYKTSMHIWYPDCIQYAPGQPMISWRADAMRFANVSPLQECQFLSWIGHRHVVSLVSSMVSHTS